MRQYFLKSESEGEWAAFAPKDRDTIQGRFKLVGLAAQVLLATPGFHPICGCWEVKLT